jgi:two-component system response regulator HydG
MRAEELELDRLLSVDPRGGRLELFGNRALLLDAVALGLLRKQLLDLLGLEGARCALSQLGYAQGWRTAKALEHGFPWDSKRDWQLAGARLHTLEGLVRVETPDHTGPGPEPFAHAVWRDSYEAEQHLVHVGKSDVPVCWTLTGFAAGYMSYVHGREVYCVEERCAATGAGSCAMVGRPAEEWEPARLAELEAIYRRSALEASLATAAKALTEVEARLATRTKLLGGEQGEGVCPETGLVSRSEAMRRVIDVARRVAKVDTTVLVTGESGVGKERIARLVHDESPRSRNAFVAVNCGALDEALLGSELFGHAKGSFTGATADREGLFEAADKGTIFLDEIGEVSPSMQVKLLRVLQEREVRRIGESKSRRVDVRVIAATNRDLAADVAAGRFREDLLYRLRVVEIRIPPLRERPDDVLDLARLALASSAERMKLAVTGFTCAAANRLLAYPWPGNVRELQNAVEHALVLSSGGRIDERDLPAQLLAGPAPAKPAPAAPAVAPSTAATALAPASPTTLEEVEKRHILTTLESVGGNREKAAELLGIGAATLYRRLKKWSDEGTL